MFKNSIIRKAGQWNKFVFLSLVEILGGVLLFAGLSTLENTKLSFMLGISGTIIGLLAFAILCVSLRCPHCGARWMWMAVSKVNSPIWQERVVGLSSCPKCKFEKTDYK